MRRFRVVWSEGMLLSPQHLQQWDRYHHHLLAERFRAAQDFDWGLTRLEVDTEALRNGRFALTAVSGILPDGTPFAAPEEDSLPSPRALSDHFDARMGSLEVSIGLPAARTDRAQVGALTQPGAPGPRWAPADALLTVRDENIGGNERDIAVVRPNLCVLFPDDTISEYDAIPIAEVTRVGENSFEPREGFVPPSLSIAASPWLVKRLEHALEGIIHLGNELSAKRQESGKYADISAGDLRLYGRLRSVNAFIPMLAHIVRHRRSHPVQAYQALASLVGELCTFSAQFKAHDVPAYDHRALGRVFRQLHDMLIELIPPPDERGFHISLEKKDGSIHVGLLGDPRYLEAGTSLFLGARAELEEVALLREMKRAKLASLDQIDYIIANALRGVPIEFVKVPPASLPTKATYFYFKLDPNCEAWEGVRRAKNIAIFAPSDLPGLALELVGLRG